MVKLYQKAQERYDKDIDILKILKVMRNLKILLSDKMMSAQAKVLIHNDKRNVINIDTSNSE